MKTETDKKCKCELCEQTTTESNTVLKLMYINDEEFLPKYRRICKSCNEKQN